MPVSYRIDAASQLVHCTATGVISLADLQGHQQRLDADAAFTFKDTARILWDFSGATSFDHSAAKIVESAESWLLSPKVRRALVAKPKGDVQKMLSLWVLHRATRRDPHVRSFDTTAQALAWLNQPE